MKNNYILRVMKLTALFLCGIFLQISARTFSQTVTLRGDKHTVLEVFDAIREQTGYHIVGDMDLVSKSKMVRIQASAMPLEQLLQTLVSGQSFSYRMIDKNIMLEAKDASVPALPKVHIRRIIDGQELYILAYPEVRGKIVDSLGNPLGGASIKVLNARGNYTSLQTTTTVSGEFLLRNVAEDAALEISYVGFVSKRIKASENVGIVILSIRPSDLDEVLINKGYYTESRKLSTGSVGVITGKTIAQQPVTNVLGALIGRVPGLEIIQAGGMPGASFQVRIRGQNSIAAGKNPLFIVDGVPFSSESMGYNQVSRQLPFIDGQSSISPFNTLNPADIASIEVLKDADATAIYGSRGANGVILITTKKGSVGVKHNSTLT